MSDRNPLGTSGRSGRVDQVGDVVDVDRGGPVPVGDGVRRLASPDGRRVVEQYPAHGVREVAPIRRRRHSDAHVGIREHVLDTFARIRGVDREEGGSRLRDRPHRLHRHGRARQAARHDRAGTRTRADQRPRETVRALVELPVREGSVGGGDREPVRVRDGPGCEDLREQRGRRRRAAARQPFLPLGRCRQIDTGDRPVVVVGHHIERRLHASAQQFGVRPGDHAGPVLHRQVQPVGERGSQRHRVVGGVDPAHRGDAQAGDVGAALEAGAVDRIRLEHREGVEDCARSCRLLHVRECDIVVFHQRRLLALHTTKQLPHGFT